jgi:Zn-finger protein
MDTEVNCQVCGRSDAAEDRLAWVMDRRDGRVRWTCPDCAAVHLRSLEAKLDPEWW